MLDSKYLQTLDFDIHIYRTIDNHINIYISNKARPVERLMLNWYQLNTISGAVKQGLIDMGVTVALSK